MKRLTRSTRQPPKQSTKRSTKRSSKTLSKGPARRAAARRAAHGPERDGNTEQQILDGAHTVFLRHGTSGARMQDIAAEAGVNQALLHYYFRSKERLSEAVFRRAAAQLLPRVIGVMASDAALEDKIARVVDIELNYLLQAPYLPGYIISELHNHPERVRQLLSAVTGMTPEHVGPQVVTRLRQQLEEGVRDGRFRPTAPDQLIVNLFSLCIFPFAARPMLMAILGMDQQGFEQFIRQRRGQLADFVLGALRP